MVSTKKYGKCAICSKEGKLSFEHIPPKSAFNKYPVSIKNHEHLNDSNSKLFGKASKSPRGFGRHTLCVLCNNNTGSWYGKDYTNFAYQSLEFLKNSTGDYLEGVYEIKPLRVIKQILSMFMSADKTGHLRSNDQLVNFILNKNKRGLPKEYKIFLYSTHSNNYRMMGYQIVSVGGVINKWSEINFPPFGFLLCENSGPAHQDMVDITDFSKYKLDQEKKIIIETVILKIKDAWIGMYDY